MHYALDLPVSSVKAKRTSIVKGNR